MTLPIPGSPSKIFKSKIMIFGGIQLILGLMSAVWTWRLWRETVRVLPASFWGALALTIFLFGLAQINLVGPLRELGYRLPVPKFALPYRLEQPFAEVFSPWPMLSIAFAFGAPVFPMIMFVLNVEGVLAEMTLIWAGLTLMGVIIGGATLYLGVQKLYVRVNGSQTIVEASALTVKPEESFSVFVRHQPGKLVTESIQVKLICRRTITQTQTRSSGKIAETTILFETDLYPETPTYSDIWQETCTVTIPKDAELSTALSASRSITWGIEVIARIPNAPDITETFLFTVDDPELRARQEAAWEAEDAQEK